MRRFFRRLLRLALLVAVLALVGVVWLILTPARHIPSLPLIDDYVYPDQGWGFGMSAPARQLYYYTPTGAVLHNLRYDWLVNLEMPWGRRRFADPAHLRSYGFVVDPEPSAANPARLPVGFARRFDPEIGEAVLDLTCAACHTGQLIVQRNGRRTAVRIDGGSAAHAFTTMRLGHFLPTLTASLASTYLNPLKFRRFGRKVLGEDGYARGKWRLHADLGEVLGAFVRQGWREDRGRLYPVEEGFGRMDGLAHTADALLGEPLRGANRVVGAAPVRYPSLWNDWKLGRFEYEGWLAQPMGRDQLEAFRAGARLWLLDRYGRPVPGEERFRSSVQIENLHRIETTLERLEPPRWPEPLLGPIDRGKAERGRVLFEQHCRRCHGPFEVPLPVKAFEAPGRAAADPLWETTLVPLTEIGSDPGAALELVSGTVDLSSLGMTAAELRAQFRPVLDEAQRRLATLAGRAAELRRANDSSASSVEADLRGRSDLLAAAARNLEAIEMRRVPLATALQLLSRVSRLRYYAQRGFSAEQGACLDGFASLDLPLTVSGYQARPLAGVWATAPYLHNGSVPTLYQLLSPQDERDVRFFVSPGAFDPVEVGVDRKAKGDGFWFDTRLPGNSNVGHEFRAGYSGSRPGEPPQYGVIGPALSERDRWALIEYLKIHEDPPTPPHRMPPPCGVP